MINTTYSRSMVWWIGVVTAEIETLFHERSYTMMKRMLDSREVAYYDEANVGFKITVTEDIKIKFGQLKWCRPVNPNDLRYQFWHLKEFLYSKDIIFLFLCLLKQKNISLVIFIVLHKLRKLQNTDLTTLLS